MILQMHLARYPYKTDNNFLEYKFISIGPRGHIKKLIRFTQITTNIFNLGFGDFDAAMNTMNDQIVTNNNDSYKVLATVASVVQDFMQKNNKPWVFATGSTRSRTRLYRMGITNNWKEINNEYVVLGFQDGGWQPFELQKQYEAFLIHRR